MAYAIGFQCTACAQCLSTCPNGAIQPGRRRYRIEPLLCTECLLYDDEPACAVACPHGAVQPAYEITLDQKESYAK